MTNNELKKQLQDLREIRPSEAWLSARRDVLLRQVRAQVSAEPASSWQSIRLIGWTVETIMASFFSVLMTRRLAAVVLVFALALGSAGYVVAASETSLPGQPLYEVKLAVESTRLNLTRTSQSRVALQIEFAARRLDEMSRLASANGGNLPQVTELVNQFETNIASVTAAAGQVSQDSPENGVAMAKLIDDSLEDYLHTLTTTSKNTTPAISKRLSKTITSVNRAGTETLKVIVEKDPSPNDSVAEKIGKKIRQAEDTLRLADERLADESLSFGGSKDSAEDARDKSAVAKINLAEARKKVSEGDYKTAVNIISEVEDIVYEVKEAAEEVALDKADGEVLGESVTTDETAVENEPATDTDQVSGTTNGEEAQDNKATDTDQVSGTTNGEEVQQVSGEVNTEVVTP